MGHQCHHRTLEKQSSQTHGSTRPTPLPKIRVKGQLQMDKAHVGTEGNEKADRLANRENARRPPPEDARTGTSSGDHTASGTQVSATQAVQAMAHAAKEHIPLATQVPRTPWITRETLQLLDQARKAEAAQSDDAKTLRNKAKRSARKTGSIGSCAITPGPIRHQLKCLECGATTKERFCGKTITPHCQ